MNAWFAYLAVECRRTVRNPQYLIFALGFPVMFYLLFSNVYGSASLGGTTVALYLVVSMSVYGALGASINTNGTRLAIERGTGWTRQLRVTPLGPVAYIAVKTFVAIGVALPAFLAVAIAGNLLHHLVLPLGSWIDLGLAVWIGVIPFAVLGVLLGYLFPADSSQSGVLVIYLGLSLMGGLWFPIASMPTAMRQVAMWLPSYHYANLGWAILAGKPIAMNDILILTAYTVGLVLLTARRYLRDESREYA